MKRFNAPSWCKFVVLRNGVVMFYASSISTATTYQQLNGGMIQEVS